MASIAKLLDGFTDTTEALRSGAALRAATALGTLTLPKVGQDVTTREGRKELVADQANEYMQEWLAQRDPPVGDLVALQWQTRWVGCRVRAANLCYSSRAERQLMSVARLERHGQSTGLWTQRVLGQAETLVRRSKEKIQ